MFYVIALVLIFNNLSHFIIAQRGELSIPEDGDCDLPWATDCLDDLKIKLWTVNGSLENYCNFANYTVNSCLKDILLGQACAERYPRYSHYNVWLKPLNSVLQKFCTFSNDHWKGLQNSKNCFQESFFNCLQHDVSSIGTLGVLELITSQMIPETCSSLDLKVEQCLQYDVVPECRLFVDTILDLVKEFIESSTCKDQPAILVPLDTGKTKNPKADDRDCSTELELEVLGKCFIPFEEMPSVQSSNALNNFCLSANETLSCLVDLLFNGCGNTEQTYAKWLDILTTIDEEFCGYKNDLEFQRCWSDYYKCFQNSNGILMLADILINKVTPDACIILIDEMESCLVNTQLECGDKLYAAILELRNKFAHNSLCDYNTKDVNYDYNEDSISKSTGSLISYNMMFIFVALIGSTTR